MYDYVCNQIVIFCFLTVTDRGTQNKLEKEGFPVDEILQPIPPAAGKFPALAGAVPRFRQWAWNRRALTLPSFQERRSPLDPVIFLTLALSVTSAGVLGTLYGPAYSVTVDGVEVGVVSSRQAVEQAVSRVESRAARILGHDYTLEQDVKCQFQVTLRDETVPVSEVETYLLDQIGEVMKSTVLSVNGQVVGAVDDESEAEAILEAIKAPYVNENTISAEFVEPVMVSREYTATSTLLDAASMTEALQANTVEEVEYIVQAGDTFSDIANDHGMRVAELQELNPDVDIDKLWIGQSLTISQAVPLLSVQTVDHVVYEGSVAYEVEEVEDSSMYEGETKVLVSGVEGTAVYDANVTYINGQEESRVINSTQVLTEPTTQVVAVGTKERPRTMATGSFQWPIYGRVSSGYGSRYIFGSYSYHSGIDIVGSYGAAIAAADGGKVIYAGTGTGSYWSYGKYVVIDHENGLQTIYAHCSSLDVQAGDRVYKGQTIARVGSTGRSTGNHCHFQVKKNGVTVNPYNYLP